MEIHQVRYFLAVCERLSFTQAARQCHVTQPSLTRAIQHLEKEFGGYLFDRRHSKVRLTELGNLVQPYLQEAWEQAQAAKKEARDYSSKAPTQLNLAIMCTIAPGLLIQMFARFRSARPDIKLDLIDGTAQSIEEQLIGSKAEAAIYCRPDRALDPRLNYLPLFREQMMIVLPVGHRLAARETIEIADLAGERYVQRSFCEFNDMVDRVFDDRGVDCETVYRSDRDDWVLAMIASGFGFGFFPRYSISNAAVVAVVAQMPTRVSKIASQSFRTAVATSEQLRNLCIKYNVVLLSQARVIAACNALHSVEARLCRWLLQSADRANSDRVALTQEFLAEMLGVRRTSVTGVAKTLHDQGVINYSRSSPLKFLSSQ